MELFQKQVPFPLDVGKDLNQRVWYTGSGPLEVMTLLDGY
jgi:hypothetical protein